MTKLPLLLQLWSGELQILYKAKAPILHNLIYLRRLFVQYFPHYSTVYLSTQLYTLKFSVFVCLFSGAPLPCCLLSPTSHPGTQQRPSTRGGPGQTWLVSKAWEESKSGQTSTFTKFLPPRPNIFCPQQKANSKSPLLKVNAHPSIPEAKHLTTLRFYLLTDLQIKMRTKAFNTFDGARHSIFTAQFSECLVSPINKSITLNHLQI